MSEVIATIGVIILGIAGLIGGYQLFFPSKKKNIENVYDNEKDLAHKLGGMEKYMAEYFKRSHSCPWYIGGGSKEFEFIQGTDGIGVYTLVRCKRCGKTIDVTDYETW